MRPSVFPFCMIISVLVCACGKRPVDYELVPGTFNQTTVITDMNGMSVDIAGDWAVFTDPYEVQFTHFIHFDQTSETTYNILENEIFTIACLQGNESLPVYDNGTVNKRKELFLCNGQTELIYLDGKIHVDYRDTQILYGTPYGDPYPLEILDEETLTHTDFPGARLRRIHSFTQ